MKPARRLLLFLLLGFAPAAQAAEKASGVVEVYKLKCQSCHMPDGDSPLEPLNFVDGLWKHGSKPAEIARVIAEGVPGSAMLSYSGQLTKKEIADLAAYVRAFDKRLKRENAKK